MSSNFGRAPAVFSAEIDTTITVSSGTTNEAGIAGVYRWGPVGKRTLVNNENTYQSIFGTPTNFNAETWFSGANFLAYSDALHVVRSANTTGAANNIANTTTSAVASVNAVSNTILVASIVKNPDVYDGIVFDAAVPFVAKYPGALGNSLKVSVCASPSAFSSNVAIVANSDVDANSAVVFTPGSNSAVVTVLPSGTGTANTTLDTANNIVNALTVGDILKIGNTSIGTQNVSVASIGAPTVIGNTVTVTLGLTTAVSLFQTVTSNTIARSWQYSTLVDRAPDVSLWQAASLNPTVIDEVHTVVIDEDGLFSGTPGSVLEVFGGLSRATNSKTDNGSSNYFKTVINTTSRYIWAGAAISGIVADVSTALVAPTQTKALTLSFTQGQDGLDEVSIPVAILAQGWDLFSSKDEVNVAYFVQGKARGSNNGTTLSNYITALAETRGDVFVALAPELSDVVNAVNSEVDNLIQFRRALTSTSYGELDCNYKYQYDKYNDVYRWVPLCGDLAGIMARSSAGTAPWMSPGGYSRGRIKNVVRLAWQPNQAQRDALYREDINPVYNVATQGPVLMGDKTLIGKNSAFSRINVRQLFILLRKNISAAAADLLFEINDDFTQAQFRNMVDPLLRDIQGRRGITSYQVICDGTNNTPQVVDNNGFAGDVYVSPARSINTIQLNFVATRTGVDFAEIVGNF